MSHRIYGLVLAGGASSRMGRDKALLRLRGHSLLDLTCDRLAPQCRGLVISRHTADDHGLPAAFPVVVDDEQERAGPLAGLVAGLDWIARTHPIVSHAVSTAVDMPFLPRDLVRRLVEVQVATEAAVVCAGSGGRCHPVAALWPVAIRSDLRSVMAGAGVRRVGDVLDRHRAAVAWWPTEPLDPFFNVNTPEDLGAAEAIMDRIGRD